MSEETSKAREMPRCHKLKIWMPFFQDVIDGVKTFEYRENDRGFQKGDVLELVEIDNRQIATGRVTRQRVTYVLSGWNLGNYVVMAIVPELHEARDE